MCESNFKFVLNFVIGVRMKTAIVLEGGGLRGAYTAGVCAWFIQNNIEFDVHIGISSGAMHACSLAMKDIKLLHDSAVNHSVDPKNVGLKAFLREGTPVGYNYMFEVIMKDKLNMTVERLHKIPSLVEFGVYQLSKQVTVWKNQMDIDENIKLLQAACTLPIAGRNVKVNGEWWMDGGVTTMIPIDRALHHNVDKMFVVTTKPSNFVRKDNGPFTQFLLDVLYGKYKTLLQDFRKRKDVYNREMAQVHQLEKEGSVVHLQPSKDFGAKRFSATYEQVQGMYELGISDCESKREQIFKFLELT